MASILVVRLPLDGAVGKAKVGQNLRPAARSRLLEKLWNRGRPGDPRAVETILAHNPDTPTPEFLRAPEAVRLRCVLSPNRVEEAVSLVANEYWNLGVSRLQIAEAHRAAVAWVGAEDSDGQLIATARAISDRCKHAFILDVAVAAGWRGRGIGRAVMELLLDHPELRRVSLIRLRTRDAHEFYRQWGFSEPEEVLPGVSDMVVRRGS